jgi:hypothetical protein
MEGNIPTGFSSMILWALVFAADIFTALVGVERNNLRRNEMMGNCFLFDLLGMRGIWKRGRRIYM